MGLSRAPKSAVEYIGAILLTDGTSPPESDNEMISDLVVIALKYGWTINQFNGALCGYYARVDQERGSDSRRTIKSDKDHLKEIQAEFDAGAAAACE